MAYQKQNFKNGEVLTAEKLNHIEDGIENLEQSTQQHFCSNPNLLDNWYFGNPVNQRGVTNQTWVNGYGIDRWNIAYAGDSQPISSLDKKGLKLQGDGTQLKQFMEFDIVNKKITISMLFSDGELRSATLTISENQLGDWVIPSCSRGNVCFLFHSNAVPMLYVNGIDSDYYIEAVKLEIGDTQTLAHQENGQWVLNEIPDYGEQLRKCQRYFVNFNPYKQAWFAMPPAVASDTYVAYSPVTLPVTMRTTPTVQWNGPVYLSQSGDTPVTDITCLEQTISANAVQLCYRTSKALTINAMYRVQGGNDTSAYIWFSAEL